jgi:hypothetical protein
LIYERDTDDDFWTTKDLVGTCSMHGCKTGEEISNQVMTSITENWTSFE